MSDAKTGLSVPRFEDQRFLTGSAVYADDINIVGQLYGVVVRSTYAHAVIQNIDISAFRADRF